MSGLLVTLRESWATHLLTYDTLDAVANWSITPKDYFNSQANGAGILNSEGATPIPIFTEKLKTLEQSITDAMLKFGIGVLIATVIAQQFEPQQPGMLYYKDITAVARVIVNPPTNLTGLEGGDVAEAIVWFTRKWNPDAAMAVKHQEIVIGTHQYGPSGARKEAVCWDVLYSIEGKTSAAPSR